MFIEDVLVDMGCTVVGVASRFEDAMHKARTFSFDVAILDVNLDGQQTFPIAEALVQRGTPFVFATGYGAATLPAQMQGVPVLQKPFKPEELERVLRATCDAERR